MIGYTTYFMTFLIFVFQIIMTLFADRLVAVLLLLLLFLIFIVSVVKWHAMLVNKMKLIIHYISGTERFLALLVRLSVLFAVSITSSSVALACYTVAVSLGWFEKYTEVRLLVSVVIYIQLDSCINCVCVGMQFPFADTAYYCACKLCHQTRNEIQKETSK